MITPLLKNHCNKIGNDIDYEHKNVIISPALYLREIQSLGELFEDVCFNGVSWRHCARLVCVSLEVNIREVGRRQDLKTVPLQRRKLLVCNERYVSVSFRHLPKKTSCAWMGGEAQSGSLKEASKSKAALSLFRQWVTDHSRERNRWLQCCMMST